MERRAGPPFRQAGAGSPLLDVTLLVVEGDPAVRGMLVRLLSRAGACVTAVGPGDLLDVSAGTAFDAAICEGSTPALSYARTLRRADPRLPLVLLDADSGHGIDRTVCIAKLDIVQRLLPALLSMLDRR